MSGVRRRLFFIAGPEAPRGFRTIFLVIRGSPVEPPDCNASAGIPGRPKAPLESSGSPQLAQAMAFGSFASWAGSYSMSQTMPTTSALRSASAPSMVSLVRDPEISADTTTSPELKDTFLFLSSSDRIGLVTLIVGISTARASAMIATVSGLCCSAALTSVATSSPRAGSIGQAQLVGLGQELRVGHHRHIGIAHLFQDLRRYARRRRGQAAEVRVGVDQVDDGPGLVRFRIVDGLRLLSATDGKREERVARVDERLERGVGADLAHDLGRAAWPFRPRCPDSRG